MPSKLARDTGRSLLLFLSAGLLHFSVYAEPPPPPGNPKMTDHLRNSWRYDQVVARIPRTRAAVSSVALARINIALHKAKRAAEQALCTGRWTPRGRLSHHEGPVIVQPEDSTDRGEFWRFQSYRHPLSISCSRISRAQFFMEMSRHLPEWIQVRPAGQMTAYRKGEAVVLKQEAVAVR